MCIARGCGEIAVKVLELSWAVFRVCELLERWRVLVVRCRIRLGLSNSNGVRLGLNGSRLLCG